MPADAKRWHLQASTSTQTADGHFTSVSLLPGLLAIGTRKGAVLIYVYNPQQSKSSVTTSSTGAAVSSQTASTNSTTASTGTATTSATSEATSSRSKGNSKDGTKQLAFRRYLRIPPPASSSSSSSSSDGTTTTTGVTSVKLCPSSRNDQHTSVFVVYNRPQTTSTTNATSGTTNNTTGGTAGICCYDFPTPSPNHATVGSPIYSPLARHDLEGRPVSSARLVDAHARRLTVARPDGLYTFSQTERVSVSPIDDGGPKLTVAMIPPAASGTNPATPASRRTPLDAATTTTSTMADETGATPSKTGTTTATTTTTSTLLGYALLASTDEKSGRDAVDVYDATNKLVAFHLLLSPGHGAIRAAGVSTPATTCSDGSLKGGRSSALVLTSGGSLVTLTEKRTVEKVDLLVKKNLYSAAVVVAYSDPSYSAAEISTLYRRYAEHLYRKGDLSGAVDQYIHTIGSLESSHVIFRFLDAPKIPLLVKYLNQLRHRGHATPVHDELLRTCYLKLNDAEAAEAIASSSSTVNRASVTSVLSNLTTNPKEALSTICALEAPEAVDILMVHGASLARVLPQATAGVVIALCVGTFSPRTLAESSTTKTAQEMMEYISSSESGKQRVCDQYPVELFASAFMEQPKMLRLILAHCHRSKCLLSPSLRRTLLELTLEEWNFAKRTQDTQALKLRHKEAIAALTDSHAKDIGDTQALVICQMAGFDDGQLLLYERLQMKPMLLERYAKEGTEKARRQMMALCQTDPELLVEVLGYFVAMASERLAHVHNPHDDNDQGAHPESAKPRHRPTEEEYAEETEDLLDDIQAVLTMARNQGACPPVRIARILAGEGTGQFSPTTNNHHNNHNHKTQQRRPPPPSSSALVPPATVPLSVALEYLGSILEDSRIEGDRLKAKVEEYNELCNSMEREIESLLRTSRGLPPTAANDDTAATSSLGNPSPMGLAALNIDELYSTIRRERDLSTTGSASNPNNTSNTNSSSSNNTNNTNGTTGTILMDTHKDGSAALSSSSSSASLPREAFWREMDQSDGGGMDTIARFFAKGVIR